MPVVAKLNNFNLITLGDRTAGGPCPVRYVVTLIGSAYYSSNLTAISRKINGKFVSV